MTFDTKVARDIADSEAMWGDSASYLRGACTVIDELKEEVKRLKDLHYERTKLTQKYILKSEELEADLKLIKNVETLLHLEGWPFAYETERNRAMEAEAKLKIAVEALEEAEDLFRLYEHTHRADAMRETLTKIKGE